MRQKLRQGAGGPPRGSTAAEQRPVSVEAISRALHLAPVPGRGGQQPSTACKFVLVVLADHAEPDSTRRSCYAVGVPNKAKTQTMTSAAAVMTPAVRLIERRIARRVGSPPAAAAP